MSCASSSVAFCPRSATASTTCAVRPLTHDEVREIARHYLIRSCTLAKSGKTIGGGRCRPRAARDPGPEPAVRRALPEAGRLLLDSGILQRTPDGRFVRRLPAVSENEGCSGLRSATEEFAIVLFRDVEGRGLAGPTERTACHAVDRKREGRRVADPEHDFVVHLDCLLLSRLHQPIHDAR